MEQPVLKGISLIEDAILESFCPEDFEIQTEYSREHYGKCKYKDEIECGICWNSRVIEPREAYLTT